MTDLYSEKDRRFASARLRNAILVYVIASVICVTVCVLFVILYTKKEQLFWLCVIVDFLLTVGLFWFTVIYFAEIIPERHGKLRLFKVMDNAVFKSVRVAFCGVSGAKKIDRTEYTECAFESGEEQIKLYVLPGAEKAFDIGGAYELRMMGERITAYAVVTDESRKEAENE